MRFLIAFLAYVVIEFLIADWLAHWFGWPAVIGLFAVGFVTGLLVLRAAGIKAAGALTQVARSGELGGNDMGDSGLLFLGGVLLAVPGILTDAAGILLIIPWTRRICRRPLAAFLGRGLRAQGVTVITTATRTGAQPTGMPPGDVIRGEVIRGDVIDRRDEPPGSSPI